MSANRVSSKVLFTVTHWQVPVLNGSWVPAPISQVEPAWSPVPGQFTGPPLLPDVQGNMTWQFTPGYVNSDPFVFTGDVLGSSYVPSDRYRTCGADVTALALVNTSRCRFPVGDGLAGNHFPISRVGSSNGDVLALPNIALGKRRREGDNALDDGEADDSR